MLENDRIYLKPLCEDDFELYNRIYSDPGLMHFIGKPFNSTSALKSFNNTLKRMSKKHSKYVLYVIKQKSNNQSVGVIGLNWNQGSKYKAETGIIILKKYQKFGYAFDASQVFLKNAFINWNLKIIISYINILNTAVLALTKKLGFSYIGIRYCQNNKTNEFILEMTLKSLNKEI